LIAKSSRSIPASKPIPGVDVLRRSLKAQLREANKMDVSYAIIIGDKELESNQLELKNFSTGDQQKIELNKIVDHMNSLSF
jgi:histidyl-tRNA synthetase